jgi:predicted RecB family nuclease
MARGDRIPAVQSAGVVFLFNDTVVYSASDLSAAATCEWALMRRLDAKLGRIDLTDEPEDPMLERAGALGDVHEQATLAKFKEQSEFVEFERGEFGQFAEVAALTEEAMKGSSEAVFQAAFFDGRLLGYADFIIRNDAGLWEVYDSKLARKAKITALLQLAAYSDQLHKLGIPTGDDVHQILGNGYTSTHPLQNIIDGRVADPKPTEWGDARYAICGRCPSCEEQVQLHRDVLLVSGMRLTQRHRLNSAGLHTIEQLAKRTAAVDGISASTLATLREQAALQIQTPVGAPPTVRLYDAAQLRAIPTPDDGDIFFDFEGDPLYSEAGGNEWGLDYLFGLIETDETFRPFWAHTYDEERQALIDFLAYVAERRREHPNLHIYHYAAYERTHLLSLAARHGVGEDQVDDLLREGVLVDLYPIVRKSMRIGSHSYSIKKLEPLYMGDDRRLGVDNAADSISEYADARLVHLDGKEEEAQAKLDDIARYNTYDCVSTLKLRDWLLDQAHAAGVLQPHEDELVLPFLERAPSPIYEALAAHNVEVQAGAS